MIGTDQILVCLRKRSGKSKDKVLATLSLLSPPHAHPPITGINTVPRESTRFREVVSDASVGALWCAGTWRHAVGQLLEEGLLEDLRVQ